MSGGPQVFLGATTFVPRTPPDFHPPRGLPARSPSALRASLGASSRSPARPRRPRGGLQSAGPRRRPRAPQSGPAVRPRRPRDDRLLNNVARNSLTRVSNVEVASLELQRFEHILKTDRCKLRATLLGVTSFLVAQMTRPRSPMPCGVCGRRRSGRRALQQRHVNARADQRRDDGGENPTELVCMEWAPHESRIDELRVNADMCQRRCR